MLLSKVARLLTVVIVVTFNGRDGCDCSLEVCERQQPVATLNHVGETGVLYNGRQPSGQITNGSAACPATPGLHVKVLCDTKFAARLLYVVAVNFCGS